MRGRQPVRYPVNGQMLTARECADLLGIPEATLRSRVYANRSPGGERAPMQKAYDYYAQKRQGTLKIVTGRKPALHRFRGRDRTLQEISEITGISRTAIYECMYRLKIPAEEAVARIEARREALARKRLMKILGF